MGNIVFFDRSIPEIGYYARTTTKGRELDMVYEYLQFLEEYYSKRKNKKAAVFIEPLIDSGYPDIVIAEYHESNYDIWNDSRFKLSNKDLKILYHIQINKCINEKDMHSILGYSQHDIDSALSRLIECDLIRYYKSGTIRNISINKYCRITKLIAIEAKIDKWKSAIMQAENNTWFSTESYILLNRNGCKSIVQEMCREYGIGIILVNKGVDCILKSEKRNFPVSHASLLFNEYIHRYVRNGS